MNDSSLNNQTAALHAASEEDLACRVQDGCADSFTELVKRLQPRLLFVLRRRLQHHADAEDIAQKTFLRAYEKIHLFNPTGKFSPWLFTIALRLAADHHRQRKLKTQQTCESASAVVDPEPNPEQQAIILEQSKDLWELADRTLKPDQWTALWLFYGEGQTVREIAQTLRRTTVSTRVLLYRARKTLTPHLAKYSAAADNESAQLDTFDGVAPAVPQIARAES